DALSVSRGAPLDAAEGRAGPHLGPPEDVAIDRVERPVDPALLAGTQHCPRLAFRSREGKEVRARAEVVIGPGRRGAVRATEDTGDIPGIEGLQPGGPLDRPRGHI